MEAPKKIYIDVSLDSAWGMTERSSGLEVEYIRKDVFIKQTCALLKDRIEHDSIDYPMATEYLIEDFRNYAKEV